MIMNRREFGRQWTPLTRSLFAVLLGWTCLMTFPTAGAQQREDPAQVVLSADLHEAPQADAAVIANLPAGESVKVVQMSGAWSRITASAGKGWVLSSRLQVGGPARASNADAGGGADAGGTSWLRSLTGFLRGSGSTRRSSSGNVTIGTRGLQREDVAHAEPNQAAVAQLDRYVVEAGEASAKANAAGLQAIDFAYLDAPQARQSNDVFNDSGKD